MDAYRLNFSRRRLTDHDLPSLRRELPLQKDALTFEEVDFSQNELGSKGLQVVLEVCRRCPKLRILKLYKNQMSDDAAQGLAELCKMCPVIEEMHLSHNHFTALGVEVLVTAAEQARPAHISPLWLRLEQNDVIEPEKVFADLQTRLSVCSRQDEVRCTVRVCCRKQKVHLPFFHLQRPARYQVNAAPAVPSGHTVQFEGPSYRVQRAAPPAEASPANRTSAPTLNAWGLNGNAAKLLAPSPSPVAGPGAANVGLPKAPSPDNKATNSDALTPARAASPVAAAVGSAAGSPLSSSRPSMVLDSGGLRRIHPKQLEAEATSRELICCLCSFVIVRPMITSCSHLFCEACFRSWVADQVSKMKSSGPGDGPVPLIPCPGPKCTTKLRKKDINLMDSVDTKDPVVGVLKRLRNNLRVRCVHHADHFKYTFGQDAERVSQKSGANCTWVGDLGGYEDHLRMGCQVEGIVRRPEADKDPSAGGHAGMAQPQQPKSAPAAATLQGASAANRFVPAPRTAGSEPAPAPQPAAPRKAEKDLQPGEVVRVAKHAYNPDGVDKVQIALKKDDWVKIFEVTESGWAAGVKISRETREEIGEAGWFPAGYLHPTDYRLS